MKRSLAVALMLACRVYPAPSATIVYQCAADSDCASGTCGTDGFCAEAPDDAGSDGGLDAGCVCAAGEGCYRGSCLPTCDGGVLSCGAGATCDLATLLCAPNASCLSCGTSEECIDLICVPRPAEGSTVPNCGDAGALEDAGPGQVQVAGALQLFASGGSANASTVAFVNLSTTVLATVDGGLYSVQLSPGIWDAYVAGPGLLTTFFPELVIRQTTAAETTALDLDAVVASTTLQDVGYVLTPGRWVWVGAIQACGGGNDWLGGYTAALSPLPGFLGYCSANAGIACLAPEAGLTSSDPGTGTFIALDVPYAIVDGIVATGLTSSVTVRDRTVDETFFAASAPDNGDAGYAVALIYPNWNQ